MIELRPLDSYDRYREVTREARRRLTGGYSNCYLMSNEVKFLIERGKLLYGQGDDGLFLGRAYPRHIQLMFYLGPNASGQDFPVAHVPLVVELPFVTKSIDDVIPQQLQDARDLMFRCGFTLGRTSHRRTCDHDTSLAKPDDGTSPLPDVIELRSCHAKAAYRFLNEVFDYRYDFIPTKDEWLREIELGHGLTCLDECGEPMGVLYFDIQGRQSELRHLAVFPAFRRRGVAKALLRGWQQRVPEEVARCFLWMDDANVPAAHLYGDEGFCFDGHRAIELVRMPEAGKDEPREF